VQPQPRCNRAGRWLPPELGLPEQQQRTSQAVRRYYAAATRAQHATTMKVGAAPVTGASSLTARDMPPGLHGNWWITQLTIWRRQLQRQQRQIEKLRHERDTLRAQLTGATGGGTPDAAAVAEGVPLAIPSKPATPTPVAGTGKLIADEGVPPPSPPLQISTENDGGWVRASVCTNGGGGCEEGNAQGEAPSYHFTPLSVPELEPAPTPETEFDTDEWHDTQSTLEWQQPREPEPEPEPQPQPEPEPEPQPSRGGGCHRGVAAAAAAQAAAAIGDTKEQKRLEVGQEVEVYSRSGGGWVSARVQEVQHGGNQAVVSYSSASSGKAMQKTVSFANLRVPQAEPPRDLPTKHELVPTPTKHDPGPGRQRSSAGDGSDGGASGTVGEVIAAGGGGGGGGGTRGRRGCCRSPPSPPLITDEM
jgi:uncharacterized membrane protein YgcG